MAFGGNTMFRAHFADLFMERLPFIDEILFENFDAPETTYDRVFNIRSSSRAFESVTAVTGFGTFSTKTEGDTVDYDKMLEGFSTRFTHLTYSKGAQISFEAADDDVDGAITDIMPPLGRSAQSSIEITAWNIINGGFDTTKTPDGLFLYDKNHLLVGGGLYDNLVEADLSISSLEDALNLFDDMIDDRGLPIHASATKLIFPTNLRWLVHEILKSPLRSDTANNAANAFDQISLEPLMVKYLTGEDDWFLFSEPSEHRVLVYWRMEPITDHTIDFDTGNFKTKMTYRLSVGAADWRNTVGGQGQ